MSTVNQTTVFQVCPIAARNLRRRLRSSALSEELCPPGLYHMCAETMPTGCGSSVDCASVDAHIRWLLTSNQLNNSEGIDLQAASKLVYLILTHEGRVYLPDC